MGTVGLTFGSPTSGTGFDVATSVAAISSNLEATKTPYQTQLTSLQSEDAAISGLGTLMSTLSTDIGNLTGATGVLSSLEGSSSDTNVLQLTSAGTGATAGSHSIVVSRLAQTSSLYSTPVPAADTLTGSLSIQVGSGTAVLVPVNAASSLSGLAASINAASDGVTASVINGSSGQQLSLTSLTGGTAGGITVDASNLKDAITGTPISFAVGLAGQDAEMTVDGIPATSSSNTVSTVLPGVTFQLLDVSPVDNSTGNATPVNVQITNNTSAVSQQITTFVSDYNAVVNALSAQEGKASTGTSQPLYGNPIIATIQTQLDEAISGSFGSGAGAVNLSTAGISIKQDGTLGLDSNALNTALNADFTGVVNLFQQSGGVGETLSSAVTNLGNSQPDALLSLAATQNTSEETSLKATLATMTASITAEEAQLTTTLNAANETLQLLPTQLNIVNELYSAITGYGQSHG